MRLHARPRPMRFVSDNEFGDNAMRGRRNGPVIGLGMMVMALLSGAGMAQVQSPLQSPLQSSVQPGQSPTKEDLIKSLECHDDQACQSPPASHRRGFQPPQGR